VALGPTQTSPPPLGEVALAAQLFDFVAQFFDFIAQFKKATASHINKYQQKEQTNSLPIIGYTQSWNKWLISHPIPAMNAAVSRAQKKSQRGFLGRYSYSYIGKFDGC